MTVKKSARVPIRLAKPKALVKVLQLQKMQKEVEVKDDFDREKIRIM